MFSPNAPMLIVDDSRTMRLILKKGLTTLGFANVIEAENGFHALMRLEENFASKSPVEAVISDWSMPRMSGLELLKNIRRDARTANLPFLMVTSVSEPSQILAAGRAGADGYLTKPFSFEQLQRCMVEIYVRVVQQKAA